MEQTDTNRTPSFLRFERTPAGTGQPHVHGIYYMHPANHSTLPSRGGNALRSGFTSEPDAWATICYGELKHSMSNEDHAGARSLGDLTFADSKCALPLQAADLLAYEAYKYAIWADGDYTKKVRPSYMLALRKFISRDDFWLYDARRFSNLRKYGEKATAKSLNSDDE